MKENIVVVGAGGFGREVLSFLDMNKYNPVGFIDRNPDNDILLPVLGDDSIISELKERNIASIICIAIGEIELRKKIYEISKNAGLIIPTIIHPNATILTDHPIGEGTIIYPNVVIMNDCKIGKGVLINSSVTLGHDVLVGNFTNINPGVNLAGRINIGEEVFIGIGSTIIENLNIGYKSIIGAGSVVIKDIAQETTVYGIPAKPYKTN